MKKSETSTLDRFQLILPKDLLAEIKDLAERDQRKTSNVMVMLLKRAMADLKASGQSLGSSSVVPPAQ